MSSDLNSEPLLKIQPISENCNEESSDSEQEKMPDIEVIAPPIQVKPQRVDKIGRVISQRKLDGMAVARARAAEIRRERNEKALLYDQIQKCTPRSVEIDYEKLAEVVSSKIKIQSARPQEKEEAEQEKPQVPRFRQPKEVVFF
jgi:hypothetical protein